MGTDLFSIDMQRGRDHGVGPYHKYYTKCTKKFVKDWSDLRDNFAAENLLLMSTIYESVFDLDLVVGVMLENKDKTDYLGAVGICLMGEQFYRTKHGDRFFYAFSNSPNPFTNGMASPIQLKIISISNMVNCLQVK